MHPQDSCRKLMESKSNLFDHEVLSIIEQHHESPDGQGFPKGLSSSQILKLPAFCILASSLMKKLIEEDFNPDKKEKIINELSTKFCKGHFQQAMDALKSALRVNIPDQVA